MIVGPYGPTYHGASYTNLYSGSVIENNEITGNHRSGIELAAGVQGGTATADYIQIRNNLITNNGWFSLADKDNLKYGHGIMFIRGGTDRLNCDASGSRYISFVNNVITGNEKSGVYIGPMNKDLFWTNNTIANNGLGTGGYSLWDGVRVDLDESYYVSATTCINYAYLTNIPSRTTASAGTGFTVCASSRRRRWGLLARPTTGGATRRVRITRRSIRAVSGNEVSDNVTFTPYMTSEYEISVVPATGLTNCSTPLTYTYHITQQAGAGTPIRGYDVKFDVDNAVVTVAVPSTDVVQLPYLSSVPGASTSFYVLDGGSGTYTVSCAILGPTAGKTGDGDLFTVKLTPVAQGTSAIAMVSLKLRDVNNQPIVVGGVGGSVQVDCTLPTMEAIAEAQNACYKVAPVFSNFGFDDDVNLDLAEYQIDALRLDLDLLRDQRHGLGQRRLGASRVRRSLRGFPHGVLPCEGRRGELERRGWYLAEAVLVVVREGHGGPCGADELCGHAGSRQGAPHVDEPDGTDFVGVEIRRVGWGGLSAATRPPGAELSGGPHGGALVTQTALAAYDDPRDAAGHLLLRGVLV